MSLSRRRARCGDYASPHRRGDDEWHKWGLRGTLPSHKQKGKGYRRIQTGDEADDENSDETDKAKEGCKRWRGNRCWKPWFLMAMMVALLGPFIQVRKHGGRRVWRR